MPKSKNTNTPKPRGKYDQKLKVNVSFLDVIKVVVQDANKKDKKKHINLERKF